MSKPVYYICRRFFTKDFPNYSNNNALDIDEVVSVDCALFPHDERHKYTKNSALEKNEQVLAVFSVFDKTDVSVPDDFEFCGYDLADADNYCGGTSALTNCPQFSEFIVKHVSLNKYGLIHDATTVEKLKNMLSENFGNDTHSDCDVFAIWRKIKS